MKYLNNLTISNIKNVYNEVSDIDKNILLDLLYLSEDNNLKFGKPYYYGKRFVIGSGYYNKTYRVSVGKLILPFFRVELIYKGEVYKKSNFKISNKVGVINAIKNFMTDSSLETVPPKSYFQKKINNYINYEKNWDGYDSNAIDQNSINTTLGIYNYISNIIYYGDIEVYPMAVQNGSSGFTILIENENVTKDVYDKRFIEMEIEGDEISIWSYSKKWSDEKSDTEIVFNYTLTESGEFEEVLYSLEGLLKLNKYIYWTYPSIQCEIRNRHIEDII